jgi:hypothetical protein
VNTDASTNTEAPAVTIVVIDDEEFTANDNLDLSGQRCSNSAYHRMGQPTWWARYDGERGTCFLDLPARIRADYPLVIDAEIVAAAAREHGPGKLVAGYGKRPSRDAHRVTLTVTLPD